MAHTIVVRNNFLDLCEKMKIELGETCKLEFFFVIEKGFFFK